MVDRRLIELMPEGSVLVNTARGALVRIADLIAALDSGRLDGAGLDVLPEEPPLAGDPALTHERILVTPHAAFFSVDAERELRRKAAQNLIQWAKQGRPAYVVVAPSS
jgi:D-3-phosphoglycerate dehydrogenase